MSKETEKKVKAPQTKPKEAKGKTQGSSGKEVSGKKEKGIHPTWYEAKVTCVCGEKFATYSTKKELKVDICSQCHPYFTGKQKIIDAEGRVEKFHARLKGKKTVEKKTKETVEA